MTFHNVFKLSVHLVFYVVRFRFDSAHNANDTLLLRKFMLWLKYCTSNSPVAARHSMHECAKSVDSKESAQNT